MRRETAPETLRIGAIPCLPAVDDRPTLCTAPPSQGTRNGRGSRSRG